MDDEESRRRMSPHFRQSGQEKRYRGTFVSGKERITSCGEKGSLIRIKCWLDLKWGIFLISLDEELEGDGFENVFRKFAYWVYSSVRRLQKCNADYVYWNWKCKDTAAIMSPISSFNIRSLKNTFCTAPCRKTSACRESMEKKSLT